MVSNAFVTKVHGGKTSHQAHLQAEALFKALLQVVGSYQDLGSYMGVSLNGGFSPQIIH